MGLLSVRLISFEEWWWREFSSDWLSSLMLNNSSLSSFEWGLWGFVSWMMFCFEGVDNELKSSLELTPFVSVIDLVTFFVYSSLFDSFISSSIKWSSLILSWKKVYVDLILSFVFYWYK